MGMLIKLTQQGQDNEIDNLAFMSGTGLGVTVDTKIEVTDGEPIIVQIGGDFITDFTNYGQSVTGDAFLLSQKALQARCFGTTVGDGSTSTAGFFRATGGATNIGLDVGGDHSIFAGLFGINKTPTEILDILSNDAAKIATLIVGASGQTADLIHTKDNGGNSFFRIAADGQVVVGIYTTTEQDALSAIKGAIIFNDTTKKFRGYDGTGWNDFH